MEKRKVRTGQELDTSRALRDHTPTVCKPSPTPSCGLDRQTFPGCHTVGTHNFLVPQMESRGPQCWPYLGISQNELRKLGLGPNGENTNQKNQLGSTVFPGPHCPKTKSLSYVRAWCLLLQKLTLLEQLDLKLFCRKLILRLYYSSSENQTAEPVLNIENQIEKHLKRPRDFMPPGHPTICEFESKSEDKIKIE